MECVEKIIKKDMIDPINGKKLTDKDIIPLQRVCKFLINKFKIKFFRLNKNTCSPSIVGDQD